VDPALVRAAGGYQLVLSVEENASAGGFGDAVARAVHVSGSRVPVRALSLGQEFLAHAARTVLLHDRDLDVAGIVRAARLSQHVAFWGQIAVAAPAITAICSQNAGG
jgi:deoxyxylulose-5-phosphate synthase